MIVLVTTVTHRYTHVPVLADIPPLRRTTWPWLLARRQLPRATYIFTDFDRLSPWQVEVAAHVFRALKTGGARVLNDPARALKRLPLLQCLAREGINSFRAWPAYDLAAVDRFPVFVRTQAGHRGNLTPLLHDVGALGAAMDSLIAQGYPQSDLMISQYRAEPAYGDVFRKLSVYRLGDRTVAAPSVFERSWTAKEGEEGAGGADGYAQDLETVRTDPFGAAALRAFEAAHIDYGRADFGLVSGKPEFYEINTNPMMHPPRPHPFPDRVEATHLSKAAYVEAMCALDSAPGRAIDVPLPAAMKVCRKRDRLMPGYQWMP